MAEPAHKVTDPERKPGQILIPIPEQFLSQYIERKGDRSSKILVDSWTWRQLTKITSNWVLFKETP